MKKEETISKIMLIISMIVFGTVGIFRRNINLPSSLIAMLRGYIGAAFILFVVLIGRKGISKTAIKNNLLKLCLSGMFIGLNWILLFEAYNYTTVATATVCYYMQTVFVLIASPFLLKEKMTVRKTVCVAVAFFGMVLVSGIFDVGISGISELKGVLFGLGAALFYSGVVLTNKKITDISAYDKTFMQLLSAAVVVTPYTVLSVDFGAIVFDKKSIICLLFVGIVITGISYVMYFGSMKSLKAQTIAIFSYIDSIVAILLSTMLIHEIMKLPEIIGALLILGSTVVSELPEKRKNDEKI